VRGNDLRRRDHVPDAVWERARAAFGDYELGQLVFAITATSARNARVERCHAARAGPLQARGVRARAA